MVKLKRMQRKERLAAGSRLLDQCRKLMRRRGGE